MASYGTITPASPPNPNKLIKHDEEKEELPFKLADENSVKLSIVSMVATLAKLKRKTLADRVVDVTRRMKSNSANLIQYTFRLSESSQQWCPKSLSEEDKLTSRMQKVLCSYSYPSDEIKDDGHYVASSIIFANGSGGKPSRPLKLAAQPNVPPYTTWIYLDRNQRMTEDQSVQGRRRIYYDPVGNETLIASDSEEEEADDEEPKHEFSRGEDFIIWSAVQERGPSALLFEQIEESLHVNRIEVQARYELLQNDVDKQAKCEDHDKAFCLQLPSTSGKRKGTKDRDCLIPRASVNGPIVENNATAGENGVTRNLIAEKFEARDLVEAMDSLDNLFCRRCLVFDCRLHGCAQSLVHPSTRQPAASVDTEALRPCGATCYKLSKHAGSDRSNSFVLWEPNAASSAFSADVSERVRVVKRQKIQESETRWIGGKRVSANCNGTSKVHASATALHMSSSHVQVVDVSNKVKSLDKTVRKRSVSGYEDASLGLKAEQIGLVSRLTSQKKITRTSKKLSSENGVIFDDSVTYQGMGNPSSKHVGVFKDDGTRAMKKLAEDVSGKLVNGLTKLENLPQKQESKNFSRGGSVTLDHESDTFPITKKKARIGKRPLEENLFTSYESKVHIAQTDGKQSAQDALCPKGWGYLSLPSPKKVAKAIKAPVKDKSSSTEMSVDKQTDGKESGQDALCPKGWGYLSLPSPKKLAKAIKAPIRDKSSSAESSVDRQIDEKESGQNALTPNGWGDLSLPLPKKPTKAMKTPGKDKSGSAETSVELEKLKYRGNGVDPYEEKSGITSPTRFVRRARESDGDELVENGNARTHEIKLDVGESSKEAESASEKSRNSAAKKLARSSRKALAEKVAGAIQQQQMQSKTENPQRSRRGKQRVDEDGSSFSEQSSERGDTVSIRTEEPFQPNLATADKILDGSCSLGLSEGNRAPLDHEGYENGVRAKSADANADSMTDGGLKVSQSESSLERMEVKDGWTELEKGLYEKGSEIFGKNSCLIANMTLKGFKTCAEVGEYMAAKEASLHGGELGAYQFPDSLACVLKWGSMDVARARARIYGRKRGSRKLKFTLKSAGQSAIRKRMGNGKDAPCKQFSPCGCLYTCGKQCPCQLSGTCCEKYCGCPKGCKNRFRGCHCAKSQCCSRQCPCFAAGRECDPDVCRNCWIGCGDGKTEGTPQREEKDNYQCHNMKLLLKQRQRVLLSKSDVAGWGAFLRRTVSKHEFLGEYTGELISHREADKRGKIYDRENSSFLFNLNDQYVLDACRKGDKLKFANHSPNPNCYAKVIMVAGDHRVGIFAKERILAGEELFYDYRYEAERAPAWASRGDDSSNGKKEDSVASERRMKHAS